MAFTSRTLCLLVIMLALCQAAVARPISDLTGPSPVAKSILSTFKDLGSLSDTLRSTAESVTVYNAGWRGYKISGGVLVIAQRVEKAIQQLEDAGSADETALSDDDAKLVIPVLSKFVQIHSLAMDAVIEKHGLVTLVPYVEGIRQALLNVEQSLFDFADSVERRIPTQEIRSAADDQFGALGVKLHECIATYEEPLLNAATVLASH
ncbi:hypothetical protein KC19_10G049900 [Ceratodon purpureus]|uniref:Uncharacterized protein n=1 Tax=Ceratodon purpureus TaxID=3225 RepID=A0A8T0GLX3_CERPU|nr:hypothetical protein KC19_10G049900 [Ceratodon purpureus]